MRIRTYILIASAAVATGFFGLGYFAVSRILDHSVQESARSASAVLARTTFASMFEVMSAGWNRQQAEAYLSAVRNAAGDREAQLQFYRGPLVAADFGAIAQPEMDDRLQQVMREGKAITDTPAGGVRYLNPLLADARCLRCHTSAKTGDVLGIVEVKYDFTPLLQQAHHEFLIWLLFSAPLVLAGASVAVWQVSRRLEQSIVIVDKAVSDIGAVADLRHVGFAGRDLGFDELNRLFRHLAELVEKLRAVAVDKDVLRFEVGLLEKFVITSDVVRDWGDYIARLLAEINTVMPTHVLFSVFQVGDEVFDLEIFWGRPPTAATRQAMENHVRAVVAADERLSELALVTLHHHLPVDGEELELDPRSVILQTKALILEQPKIGGIVGIGVHVSTNDDETLRLVMDSILSTMLNVVGSVKAIHKYTHDMEYYATRDPLTDLCNRRVFQEMFDFEAALATRQGYNFALLVMDLDNFKLINDSHGHALGDAYLQAVAQAVKPVLRPGDIFARYGGDEFVILLPDVMPEVANAIAQRVQETVRQVRINAPFGAAISGSASIGLGVFPLHANNAKDLFLFADSMMYKAKRAGRDQIGVPNEEDVATVFRDLAETTMMVVKAVNDGRIEPFFQPIMDLATGRIIGFEALSRLTLEGQQIEAARFIEYAEKAGVIHQLDTMIMQKSLRAVAAAGFTGQIFINLSPRALTLSDFMLTLRHVVAEHAIDPERIVFEITERDTLRNLNTLEHLFGELKLAGFKLAIDDFGSGFASFQHLRRLPVDYLKIEGDFVMNMLADAKDRALVETIYRLAANLGIQVIAEHVESQEVLDALKEIGVEMAQGYFIGRPEKALAGNLHWPLAKATRA
jgi:diguanylate cyclase (GGDEF)-like protein